MYINSATRITDVLDGTSNVLLMGEQTDWTVDGSGVQNSCRASGVCQSYWQGDWWTGHTIGNGYDHCFNTNTIAVNLGTRVCTQSLLNCQGEYGSQWTNSPLRSTHGNGGTNALFADGSVRYLAVGIDLTTFQLLAIRDSGAVKTLN